MKQIKEFLVKQFSQQKKAEQTEKCILCGGETEILVTEPICNRKNYIQGCGQLCESCYHSLRHDSRYFG